MNNSFSQPKVIYKISFNTKYKNLEFLEAFLAENEEVQGTSSYEVLSTTIDSKPEDIWCLEAYLFDKPDLSSLERSLNKFSDENDLGRITDLALQIIEDKDWVSEYQKQLKPIPIGRFCLGSKDILNNLNPEAEIPIYLEASRAFGTGDHQTTAGCIEAMEYLVENLPSGELKKIFDIGTGSGVLSFVAEKLWPDAEVTGCDIDPVSVEIAQINKEANQSKASFYLNNEEEKSLFTGDKYNLIISNILAKPLISLAPSIKQICHDNAYVILSGFLGNQLPEVEAAYTKNGFVSQKIIIKDDWIIIILKLISSHYPITIDKRY